MTKQRVDDRAVGDYRAEGTMTKQRENGRGRLWGMTEQRDDDGEITERGEI